MKYVFTLLTVLCFQVSFGQAELSLSLDQALEMALRKNTTMLNAALDIDYAETQVNELKAQGLPQVSGSADFSHTFKIPTQIIPGDFVGQPGTTIATQFGVPFNVNVGVGASQLLFDGTFFLGLKAASEFVNISKLSASASEIDIKEGVTKAYYMALISQQNIGQLSASLANIKKLQSETEQLYKAGFAEKLDVDRLTLSVSNLEININKLQNQAKLAKQLLLNTIGVDVNQELTLTSKIPGEPTSDSYAAVFNPENRIEIKLIDQQQELNQLNLKRYKMGYFPSIYGNFSYGSSTFASDGKFGELGDDWYGNGRYAVSLNVPIFDGLYKKAKMDQAKIDFKKTENTKQQALLGMNLQVGQAKTNYLNALKTIELQKKSQDLAESIFNTTKIKFKEGIGSSFEMINAESELTQANTNYLIALYELNVARIDLNKALGIL
ncbi:MAG: TolC family protein [Bacteroidia bacterium]|jgi:outer membrane protein|nr:TolC family protein [Bacteroidia bacterium]|tara:strand:+ start:348 stop:1664 length:1317 start_codon:yes stop_codon:yes gene_type:complete